MREWPKWNSFWWSGSLLAIAWLPIPSFEVVAKLLHPNALYHGTMVGLGMVWVIWITLPFSFTAAILLICKFLRALNLALQEETNY